MALASERKQNRHEPQPASMVTFHQPSLRLGKLVRPSGTAGRGVESVLLDFAEQLLTVKAQQIGCRALVVARPQERPLDMIAFQLGERRPRDRGCHGIRSGRRRGGNVIRQRPALPALLTPQRFLAGPMQRRLTTCASIKASNNRRCSGSKAPRSTSSSPKGRCLAATQACMADSTSSGSANSFWRAKTAKSRLRSEGSVGIGY